MVLLRTKEMLRRIVALWWQFQILAFILVGSVPLILEQKRRTFYLYFKNVAVHKNNINKGEQKVGPEKKKQQILSYLFPEFLFSYFIPKELTNTQFLCQLVIRVISALLIFSSFVFFVGFFFWLFVCCGVFFVLGAEDFIFTLVWKEKLASDGLFGLAVRMWRTWHD